MDRAPPGEGLPASQNDIDISRADLETATDATGHFGRGVEGQIRGGVVQGIGTALYEEIPYDDAGQPLAGTLADYLLPGAVEMPAIKIGHLHTPTPHTEYGMKGMGEGGAVAPPGAIANAIRDALAGIGAEVNETPITPRRVFTAIKAARNAAVSS